MKEHSTRHILLDAFVGGLIGGLIGAVVAVNFVLFVGVDQGYQASLGEVFEHSTIAGVATLVILVAGPVAGFLAARRRRALNESMQESGVERDSLTR